MSQIVSFKLNDEEYGFPIETVEEIQNYTSPIDVPGAPKYVAGLINLRGRIVVLIDLKERFGMDTNNSSPTHIIVINSKQSPFAVMVDGASGVIKVADGEIKKSPKILETKIDASYITGVYVNGERAVVVLDPLAIIADEVVKDASGVVSV